MTLCCLISHFRNLIKLFSPSTFLNIHSIDWSFNGASSKHQITLTPMIPSLLCANASFKLANVTNYALLLSGVCVHSLHMFFISLYASTWHLILSFSSKRNQHNCSNFSLFHKENIIQIHRTWKQFENDSRIWRRLLPWRR